MLKKFIFSFFLFSFFGTMAFCFSEDFVIGEPLFEFVTLDNNILMRDFSTGVIERREICFDLEVCNENKRIDYDEDIIQQNSLLLRKYPSEGKHEIQVVNYTDQGIFTGYFPITTSMDYSDPYKEFSFMSLPKMEISKNQKQIWVPQKYHHQVGFFLQEKEKIPYKNGFIDTDLVVDSDGDGYSDNDQDILFDQVTLWQYDSSLSEVFGKIVYTRSGEWKQEYFTVNFESFESDYNAGENLLYQEISTLIRELSNEDSLQYQLKLKLDLLRRSLKDQEQVDKVITELKNDIENFEVILAKQNFVLLQVMIQELSPIEEDGEDSEEEEIDEEIENLDLNEEVFIEIFDTKLYDQIKRSILDSFSGNAKKELEIKFNTFEIIEGNLDGEQIYQELMQLFLYSVKQLGTGELDSNNSVISQFCSLFPIFHLQIEQCSLEYLQQWDSNHQIKKNTLYEIQDSHNEKLIENFEEVGSGNIPLREDESTEKTNSSNIYILFRLLILLTLGCGIGCLGWIFFAKEK